MNTARRFDDFPPYTPIEPFEVLSARLGRPAEEIVKLDANENPYGPSPLVRKALSELGICAEPALLQALHHQDNHVRWHAARLLGQIGDPRAVDVLVTGLWDEDQQVRWATARVLANLDMPAVPAILEALSHQPLTEEFRQAAFHALHSMTNQATQAYLQPLLRVLGSGRDTVYWQSLARDAESLRAALRRTYAEQGKLTRSALLQLAAWAAGAGEVWLAMTFLGHPVTLLEALLLESLVQAIRNMAFIVPGALGVQDGGLLLLGPLLGIHADTALALSLLKRGRELLLGAPGLVAWYWHHLRRGAL